MTDTSITRPARQSGRWRRPTTLLLLGLALAVAADRAGAQQSTTATYEDWTLRCSTTAGPPPQKSCDMEQTSRIQNSQQPFSRVGLSRSPKGGAIALAVQVPVNVWLAPGVHIEVGGKDAGLSAPFMRCAPGGCFASIPLNDAALQKFRVGTAPVTIVFENGARQKVAIPLSFKGFGQAFDALAKD